MTINYILLILFGIITGIFGTLIGAGGGFIVAPVLLVLYPKENPLVITSISLAVSFANSFSGTIAYARLKKINYKYGLLFAIAGIPGATFGAFIINYVDRSSFNFIFSIVLLITSFYLFFKKGFHQNHSINGEISLTRLKLIFGMIFSFIIGIISTFLGIGGGIIHVPILSGILSFPIHVATATSHFILVIMTLTGVIVHILNGDFFSGFNRIIFISIGVIIGAQIGAALSKKINGLIILKLLAIALFIVSIRLFLLSFKL